MPAKERVIAAIRHDNPDYTPGNVELCTPTMRAFSEKYGISKEAFFDFAGNHIEKISYNGGEYIEEKFFRDEFGVVWDRTIDSDIGNVQKYFFEKADLSNFSLPRIDVDDIKQRTEKVLNNGRQTFKPGKIGMLLFERAWSLRGMEELLVDFYGEEDFVHELFNKITDYNIAIINEALKYPIDGFYFADDYGMQTGMLMGPSLWRKFCKPYLARTFSPIKAKGLPVIFHSCGNILDVLDDMVEIGLDCYQTVQPEIYDLKELKKRYGGRLAFYGAISTQQFLPFAKPDEVKAKVKETISVLGANGGYICAPTHQVPWDVPEENVMAMIEALREQSQKL
jgi:uroporphyrinogen decarboxylase